MWNHRLRIALAGVLVVSAGGRASAQETRPSGTRDRYRRNDRLRGRLLDGNPTRVPSPNCCAFAGLDSIATIASEQFLNVASSDIGPERWLELSRRISVVFASRPELRGIVVTHGTDTMEETAYFLDLTVSDARPVIVTGSMRPSNMVGADGPANLTGSRAPRWTPPAVVAERWC